jgi:hypothetical protein
MPWAKPTEEQFVRTLYAEALETARAKGMSGPAAEALACRTASLLASRGLKRAVMPEDVRRLLDLGQRD